MSMFPWRVEMARDYKSMLKIAFIAKPVISRIQVRTLTGSLQREAVDLPTMECKTH